MDLAADTFGSGRTGRSVEGMEDDEEDTGRSVPDVEADVRRLDELEHEIAELRTQVSEEAKPGHSITAHMLHFEHHEEPGKPDHPMFDR